MAISVCEEEANLIENTVNSTSGSPFRTYILFSFGYLVCFSRFVSNVFIRLPLYLYCLCRFYALDRTSSSN